MCSAFERRVFLRESACRDRSVKPLDVYSVKIGDNALYTVSESYLKFSKEISLSHGNKKAFETFNNVDFY